MTKLLSATAIAVVLACGPAFAATPDELQAQIEILKRQEAAKNTEIEKLRKKIKALEVNHSNVSPALPPTAAMAAVPGGKVVNFVPAPSWAGFYFGAGVTRNKTRADQGVATMTEIATAPPNSQVDQLSLARSDFNNSGHVLAGYLWQFNTRWLAGVEADYTFSQHANFGTQYFGASGGPCGVPFTGAFTCAAANPFGTFETVGHLRALGGIAISPDLMAFLAGGLAVGRANLGTHTSIAIASSPAQPVFTGNDSAAGREYLLGWSLGAGIQARVADQLIARVEFLHDAYSGLTVPGSTTALALNGHSTTIVVPAEKVKLTNDAVRFSLLYQIDGDRSPRASVATFWDRFVTDPGLTNASWAGFYLGGGVTQNNFQIAQDSGRTLTIDDSNTVGVLDLTSNGGFAWKAENVSLHLLGGYRYQWNRFLVGIEGDWDFGAQNDFVTRDKSPGLFGGPSAPLQCYPQFLPAAVCIGGANAGTPYFKSVGHLKFTGGFVITPELMAFGSYGWAWGKAGGSLGASASGIVDVPPGAPLVGAATVTRTFDGLQMVRGHTIGGGVEFKATDAFSIRGEYYHDWYTWDHLPIGGAGFGGTTGNITVNSFNAAAATHTISNDAYRVSLIYRFYNPQSEAAPNFLSGLASLTSIFR